MTVRRRRKAFAGVALGLVSLAVPASAAGRPAPSIDAPSAIVIEASTGDVTFARNADQRRQIASTTKMMTALISRDRLRLGDTVRAVPYPASAVESKINLRAGEEMTVADLLRALMLASANDAAATLAVRAGGSRRAFVAQMNARARELGLDRTRFANPIGLDDPDNYSTAADLVALAVALRKDPFLRQTVARAQVSLSSGARGRTLVNRNALVRAGQAEGVKTGHTRRAGYVLVGSRTRNGITVISAVLGGSSESSRDADSLALLSWALDEYRHERVLKGGVAVATLPVKYRDDRVAVVPQRAVSRVVRADERLNLIVRGLPTTIDGPVAAGSQVGTASVSLSDGTQIARVPLVLASDVPAAGIFRRARAWFADRWMMVLLGAGGVGGTLWVRRYRRLRAERRSEEAEQRRVRREQAHTALNEQRPTA